VDKEQPEIRVPSIRGQLRFWTRLLYKNAGAASDVEYLLFGGIKGKLEAMGRRGRERHCIPCPSDTFAAAGAIRSMPSRFRKGKRASLPPGVRFELRWFERLRHNEDRVTKLGTCSRMAAIRRTWRPDD